MGFRERQLASGPYGDDPAMLRAFDDRTAQKGDCVIVNEGVRWRAVHAAANTLGPSLQ
jgi:hypothetical protein